MTIHSSTVNLTSLAASGPLPLDGIPKEKQTYVASQVVPFATHAVTQVLECPSRQPTKQIRFIVCVDRRKTQVEPRADAHFSSSNDAVVPPSYEGCGKDQDGLCSFDTVVSGLKNRIAEIDFEYDCFAS
jgi:hypothetical protein